MVINSWSCIVLKKQVMNDIRLFFTDYYFKCIFTRTFLNALFKLPQSGSLQRYYIKYSINFKRASFK